MISGAVAAAVRCLQFVRPRPRVRSAAVVVAVKPRPRVVRRVATLTLACGGAAAPVPVFVPPLPLPYPPVWVDPPAQVWPDVPFVFAGPPVSLTPFMGTILPEMGVDPQPTESVSEPAAVLLFCGALATIYILGMRRSTCH